MSVRILYFSPFSSSIKPIAIPAAGDFIGTPPSIKANVDPHTEAMDEEPLEERISETTRMVYGNLSLGGIIGSRDLSAKAPWPISRRPPPPIRPTSPALK